MRWLRTSLIVFVCSFVSNVMGGDADVYLYGRNSPIIKEYMPEAKDPHLLFMNIGASRVVEFYSPHCPACIRFSKSYKKLASNTRKKYPSILFFAVSCDEHSDLCDEYNLDGFPTIRLFKPSDKKGSQGKLLELDSEDAENKQAPDKLAKYFFGKKKSKATSTINEVKKSEGMMTNDKHVEAEIKGAKPKEVEAKVVKQEKKYKDIEFSDKKQQENRDEENMSESGNKNEDDDGPSIVKVKQNLLSVKADGSDDNGSDDDDRINTAKGKGDKYPSSGEADENDDDDSITAGKVKGDKKPSSGKADGNDDDDSITAGKLKGDNKKPSSGEADGNDDDDSITAGKVKGDKKPSLGKVDGSDDDKESAANGTGEKKLSSGKTVGSDDDDSITAGKVKGDKKLSLGKVDGSDDDKESAANGTGEKKLSSGKTVGSDNDNSITAGKVKDKSISAGKVNEHGDDDSISAAKGKGNKLSVKVEGSDDDDSISAGKVNELDDDDSISAAKGKGNKLSVKVEGSDDDDSISAGKVNELDDDDSISAAKGKGNKLSVKVEGSDDDDSISAGKVNELDDDDSISAAKGKGNKLSVKVEGSDDDDSISAGKVNERDDDDSISAAKTKGDNNGEINNDDDVGTKVPSEGNRLGLRDRLRKKQRERAARSESKALKFNEDKDAKESTKDDDDDDDSVNRFADVFKSRMGRDWLKRPSRSSLFDENTNGMKNYIPGTEEYDARNQAIQKRIRKESGKKTSIEIQRDGLKKGFLPYTKVGKIHRWSSEEAMLISDASLSLITSLTSQSYFDGKQMAFAFKDWLDLLSVSLPSDWDIQKLIDELRAKFNPIEHDMNSVKNIVQAYDNPYKDWSKSCKNRKLSTDGFTCGLWKLLHVVTIGVAEQRGGGNLIASGMMPTETKVFSPKAAADVMRSYLGKFFTCKPCRSHFVETYDDCNNNNRCKRLRDDENSRNAADWKELSLWLWEFHNDVNVRLLRERNEIDRLPPEEEVKVIWPQKHDCSKCLNDNGRWNKGEVFRFLERTFWPEADVNPLKDNLLIFEKQGFTASSLLWLVAFAILGLIYKTTSLQNQAIRQPLLTAKLLAARREKERIA